jgi:hypothetical protein
VGSHQTLEQKLATSGSVDFSYNALQLLEGAYSDIGVKSADRPLTAYQITQGLLKLNLLVKQLTTSDFAPGLKMWSRKRAYVFLQKDQAQYNLGPSGDNATTSYVTTTISANEAAGQTALSITSETGITAADNIGIQLNTGYIQWTTVVSTASGSVTVTDALTSAADAGNRVFAYTTKMRRPLEILTALIRDTDDQDSPIYEMDVYEYESIADKESEGTPSKHYYEAQLTNGVLYLNRTPDDVTKVIRLVYLSPLEDLDATTDDIDCPQIWFKPIQAQLSIDLCPTFNRPITDALKLMRDEAMLIAKNADPETTTISFQPGLD